MPWFKVDDTLTFHRKTVSAGNAAMGLWVRAGSWCALHLTDGFIPDEMVGILGSPSQRKKLISAGLWIEVDGGCLFHEWNENGRQPTGKSVRERRSAAAKRQQDYRDKLQANSQVRQPRNAVTDASVTQPVTPVFTGYPTRPDPCTSDEVHEETPTADAVGRAELALVPSRITAQDCGAAWVDAFRASGVQPAKRQIGQAVREAKQLIEAGNPPELVLDLARTAGGKRRATVVNELAHRAGRPQGTTNTTSDKIARLQALKTGSDDPRAPLSGSDHP